MLSSSNLDEHKLRSCIRNIVKLIKSRRGIRHVPSWSLPQRFTPRVDHKCPYIYTLPNDAQVRSNASRIMMEDIRAREDDAARLQVRASMAGMAQALGLEVMVPGDGNCFLHAARFALLQLHGMKAMRAEMWSIHVDGNGMSLDDVRLAWRDPRPIPPAGVVLEPPRQDFYNSWDQWVNEM